ncbi:MAG: transposase [Chthonomonas sp.]|nr:transposase [Chthonomonas sp.]
MNQSDDHGTEPVFEFADSAITKTQGFYLPHWTRENGIYHVVFRLVDSLPKDVVLLLRDEKAHLLSHHCDQELNDVQIRRLNELSSARVSDALDRGIGECLLRNSAAAEIMEAVVRHFDKQRYHLHAWCIMPNHVHTVLQPIAPFKLPDITHSWKSYSAHAINKALGRTGSLWHKESYDHLIRTEQSYRRIIQYVLDNPARAGLRNWKWVGAVEID